MAQFTRYLGIDYSGAETADSSCKGLRAYVADGTATPEQVQPPPSPRRYWTRRGLAEWLCEELDRDIPTLWDAWKEPDGGWLISYAIITTEPNELTATVHNRMPVILKPSDYDRWLSRDETEQPPVDLLRPYDAEKMSAHPVDPRVGNVKVNEPGLCDAWTCPPNSA